MSLFSSLSKIARSLLLLEAALSLPSDLSAQSTASQAFRSWPKDQTPYVRPIVPDDFRPQRGASGGAGGVAKVGGARKSAHERGRLTAQREEDAKSYGTIQRARVFTTVAISTS